MLSRGYNQVTIDGQSISSLSFEINDTIAGKIADAKLMQKLVDCLDIQISLKRKYSSTLVLTDKFPNDGEVPVKVSVNGNGNSTVSNKF